MSTLNVTIDGVKVAVPAGVTILQAAREAGVHIPVFCHDDRLNPFGACRVCLVEVKNNPKMMTACTTPVTEGMEVTTNNEKLNSIRKTLIELLLINHPLDCPVCDKGGECTLQDLTYEFGLGKVRFDAKPNDTKVDHTNPFIERDVDRCVLCGRCVRICDEVVNVQAISFLNRGHETYIGTAFDQPWDCEFCGQCMSVCPVGSLNNRVYLFKNRPWNLQVQESVCGLCSCGCNVNLEYEGNELYRMTDKEDSINHGYLCAKGRFGFELVNRADREVQPQVKSGSEKKAVSLDEAVKVVAEKLKGFAPETVGVLVSPRLTNEEAFSAQKFAREVLKTNNVYSVESAAFCPEATYAEVENADAVLVLNIDVTESNPILGLAVRHAARKKGADLTVFYPSYTALKRLAKRFVTGTPESVYAEMDKLVAAIAKPAGDYKAVAEKLKGAEHPVLVFNPYNAADAYYVSAIKAAVPAVKLVPAKAKNNSQGIVDMGALNGFGPGLAEVTAGADLKEALAGGKLKALLVLGENLFVRTGYAEAAEKLGGLEFLAVCDPFASETTEKAHVWIPTATFAEKSGSFTNLEGRVQTISKAVSKGTVCDLTVLSRVAAAMGATLSDSVAAVQGEIVKANKLYTADIFAGGVVKYPYAVKAAADKAKSVVSGSGAFSLYPAALRLHSGSFTHTSPDLAKVYGEPMLEVGVEDAKTLGVKTNDTVTMKVNGSSVKFRVKVDKLIAKGCVSLPEDYLATAKIFSAGRYQKVEVAR